MFEGFEKLWIYRESSRNLRLQSHVYAPRKVSSPFVIVPSAGDEFAAETNVDTFLQRKLQELSLASAIYQKAQNLINREIDKRNDLLLEKTDQLYDVSAENLGERLALIEDIFILGGDAESRQTNREATLQAASRQAFSWLQTGSI